MTLASPAIRHARFFGSLSCNGLPLVHCRVNGATSTHTGTDSLGACFGHAYGFVSAAGKDLDVNCDWTLNDAPLGRQALYLGIDGTPGCNGAITASTTETTGNVPATMALWVR